MKLMRNSATAVPVCGMGVTWMWFQVMKLACKVGGVSTPESRMLLDECLLDDLEFARGPKAWQTYTDPFPTWWVGSRMQ